MKALLIVIVMAAMGCAATEGFRTVPRERWDGVPIDKRAATDATIDASLAAARAEETAALAAVAETERALAAPRSPRDRRATTWVAKLLNGEQRKVLARAEVERARRASLEADLVWRQRRVEAARARLAMAEANRELTRAIVIDDRARTDDEGLDVPWFRGQHARAQAAWYSATAVVTDARLALTRTHDQLVAAKEVFAQLVRAEVPELPLQLPRWAKASDLRRRGLKVTDRSSPLPCRRRTCFRQPVADTIYLTIAMPRSRPRR